MEETSSRRSFKPLLAQCRLLVLRLLLALVLYTLCRGIFYLYNKDLLGLSTTGEIGRIFVGGFRFDLSAILYTHLLLTVLSLLPLRVAYTSLYQRVMTWLYRFTIISALILNLGDTVYYRFTLRRTTLAVFDEFQAENPLHFLRFFIDYWGITIVGVVLIALFILIERRLPRPKSYPEGRVWPVYLTSVGLLALGIYLSIVGGRGGFTAETRPITMSNAALYIQQPHQRAMVLNTPFCLIRMLGKNGLPELTYMPFSEAAKYFNPIYTPGQTPLSGMFRGRNVVLIIWESFGREWVGALNRDIKGYKGYTPFIDSLIERSYVFENAYANGGKSIDAMPSIFTSIISPNVSFVLSVYSGNDLPSLPRRLSGMGYTTAFFHGAPNGSMGFDAFTRQVGISRYYGMTEYNNAKDYDGQWGIWDEKFLQYVAKELGTLPQPFFAAEFTLSSHHPFRVPDEYKSVLPKGSHPMHQVIAYSDMALRRFFETASKQPWYENTLFVIVADHAVPGALDEYKTTSGIFRVPIILFDPRGQLVGREPHQIVSQTDLYPTILDLVGDTHPMVAFGSSVFDPNRPRFTVQEIDGMHQMIEGDWLLLFDGAQPKALYNLRTDPRQTTDLKDQPNTPLPAMLLRLKAYLQEYTHRMRENRLISLEPSR